MKFLYLVRHAKSISAELGINDFKRSLSKQGLEDAKAMGKRLKKKGISPGLLLSSPADRALETAHIFAQEMDYPVPKILLKDEFYDDDLGIILEILKSIPADHDSLMLFGHEPILSQLAALFLKDTEVELRTSGVLGIALEIENWQELAEAEGKLIFFDFPVRATPKVYKKARKAIAAEITAGMEHILEDIDSGASKHLEKILEKTSKKLAKQLTKVLHASKVEDIAKVKRERQRLDTREELEQSLAEQVASDENHQSAESAEQESEVSKQSALIEQNPIVENVDTESTDGLNTQAQEKTPGAAARKTSVPKNTPASRSSRRKSTAPEQVPIATQQPDVEKNAPASKTTTRRRSTRRKTPATKKSPTTQTRRTTEPTSGSDDPRSEK